MKVQWFSVNPIRYNPEIGLPEFAITKINSKYCNGTFDYAITETEHRTGNDGLQVILLRFSLPVS